MKKTLITDITGQNSSYLAELLLSKGYKVHGMIGHSSSFNNHVYRDSHLTRSVPPRALGIIK